MRRWRWLAALLVVLSPPVAGTAIPIIDPCPVDAPWLITQADEGHHAHSGHADAGHADPSEAKDPHSQHTSCHCIGACAGAATVGLGPDTGLVLAETPAMSVGVRAAPAAPDRIARPRFLLPPSHAPPVV
ncbi:MAG: hypothetical protein ACYC2K_04520 [Gemmatimonadales bacterium]